MFFDPLSVHLLLAVILCALPPFVLLNRLWLLLDRVAKVESADQSHASFWVWLSSAAFIAIAWLPYLLASWPGFFCYDMGGDHGEWIAFSSGEPTSHYPLLHVLFVGFFVEIGRACLPPYSFNGGIILLTIVQFVILVVAFGYIVAWLKSRGAPKLLVMLSLCYFALDPVIAMFAMCTSRDTLFSIITLLFCIKLYEMLCQAKANEKIARSSVAAVCAFGFLLCITRNNGVYAFVVAVISISLIAPKALRKYAALGGAAILACSLIWFGPICHNVFNVKDNQSRGEMLGMPIQHLAFLSISGRLGENEIESLKNAGYAFPDRETYNPKLSDYSKYTVQDMNTKDLLRLYAQIGINHPKAFLYAELSRTEDLWSPFSYPSCYNDAGIAYYQNRETSFFATATESPGVEDSLFPQVKSFLDKVGGSLALQTIPYAALLVSLPLLLALLLVVFTRALTVQSVSAICGLLPLAAIVLTCYFGPCVLPRYYMCLFFAVPFLTYLLISTKRGCGSLVHSECD